MVCSTDSVEVPAGWSPTPMFSIFDEVSLYELLFTIGRFMVIFFLPLFSAPSHFFSTQGKVYWFSFFSFFLSFFLLSRPMCGKRDILGGRNK